MLCNVYLGDAGVVVYKCKEVSLTSETDRCYWTCKVAVNILVEFCYPLLGCPIVPLYGFCLFVTIANIFFSIIDKDNVLIGELFLQRGKIEVSKTLISAREGQLFVLRLLIFDFSLLEISSYLRKLIAAINKLSGCKMKLVLYCLAKAKTFCVS